MAKTGRPTQYTPEIGDFICEQISRKRALASICDSDNSLPCARTVYRWLREHEEFCQNYIIAKDDQAEFLAEDTLEISDDLEIDPQHKRIMVDTRKWLASKFKPKKYGDKIYNEHSGYVGVYSELSSDELDRQIREKQQMFESSQGD